MDESFKGEQETVYAEEMDIQNLYILTNNFNALYS